MLTQRRTGVLLGLVLAVAAAAACSSSGSQVTPGGADPGDLLVPTTAVIEATTSAAPDQPAKDTRVRIAFGGDVHFEGSSASALSGGIGSAGSLLKAADLAIVNLETAITDRGTAAPKQYTFRAPATGLTALRSAGVDVVTLANNHGMDYGRVGLADTLAAGKRSDLPVIGAGADVTAAFKPFRRTIRGLTVSVLAATDVLDSFAVASWPATGTRSGLASSKDPELLLAAVRSAAKESDVVVVVLHWGVELESCPSQRQRTLASDLTEAGADVVVGSHAHVLGPQVRDGRTAIHYGLGNFVFYARTSPGNQTGVYTVVVDRDGVVRTRWSPAVIRGGRPELLTGSAAKTAASGQKALAARCGLT